MPARQAFVNEMVDPEQHGQRRRASDSASFNLARMIGPALAGVLIAAMGSGVAATGLGHPAQRRQLRRRRDLHGDDAQQRAAPDQAAHAHEGQLRDGVRYVRARPDILLMLAIVFCAGTFGLNFQMTTALMATEVYGKGAGEYGLLGSILAIGSLAGSLLAARRRRPRQRGDRRPAIAFGAVRGARRLDADLPGRSPSILPLCGLPPS